VLWWRQEGFFFGGTRLFFLAYTVFKEKKITSSDPSLAVLGGFKLAARLGDILGGRGHKLRRHFFSTLARARKKEMAEVAAARPGYWLDKKSLTVRGTPRTVYTLFFRDDVWAEGHAKSSSLRFGGAPAEIAVPPHYAEQAYLNAAVAHTNGEIRSVPPHVELVTLASSVMGFGDRLVVPTSIVDSSRKEWIYIVEGNASICAIECAGGMPMASFKKFARRSVSGYTIFRAQCDPTAFYDTVAFDRESSLPPMPSPLISPHSSIVSSSGLSAPSPLLDYGGDTATAPREVVMLRDIVAAHVARSHLLGERYASLQKIELFTKKEGGAAPTSARARFEAATIALFEDFGDADADMQHRVDVVTHWDVRKYVLPMLRLPHQRAWFVEQEARLVSLRLLMANSDDLARLVSPVVDEFELKEGEGGYSVSAMDALLAGIDLNAGGVGATIANGRVVLTVEQVANELLPEWIARAMRGELRIVPTTTTDEEEEDDEDIRAKASEIVSDRDSIIKGASARLRLPVNDPAVTESLPDIEDLGAANAMYPPCVRLLREKLEVEGRLKYGERLAYTNFLYDVNYRQPVVEDHLRKHFTTTGCVSTDLFKRKYATSAKRAEPGDVWVDGVRTIPYSNSCANLIAGKNIRGDDRGSQHLKLGCPFNRLGRDDLSALLTRMGVQDVEGVIYTAHVERNCAGACASAFANKYGKLPDAGPRLAVWRPSAPRVWFGEAKDMFDDE
jgi:hypothetical protein